MVDFQTRVFNGLTDAVLWSPFLASCGGLWGYAYAKIAHLPPVQVAQCWALYAVAANALRCIATSFVENKRSKTLIDATMITVSGPLFVLKMRQMRLMEDKMAIFILAVHVVGILGLLNKTFNPDLKAK